MLACKPGRTHVFGNDGHKHQSVTISVGNSYMVGELYVTDTHPDPLPVPDVVTHADDNTKIPRLEEISTRDLFLILWTRATHQAGYVKAEWMELSNRLDPFFFSRA